MFFRNIIDYRLPQGWTLSAEQLASALERTPFQECGSSATMSSGWVAPRPNGALVHSVGGHLLVALKREVKAVPSAAIKKAAEERVKKISEEEGRNVGKKELKEIKALIATELLPRAFAKESITYAWIDPKNGWLSIDASTPAKAEDLLEMLRKSVEPAPNIALTKLNVAPSTAMTSWIVANEAPSNFTLDQDLELTSAENSKVKYTKHTLEGEDIRQHIAEGKTVSKLAMTWDDRISFVLTASSQVKKLTFLDILKKDQADNPADNEEEKFDSDFALMAGELARLKVDLVGALGGEMALA